MAPHILIVGVSARAAAESAVRAGFPVTAIDAYADSDQHPAVRILSWARDFGSPAGARAAARAAGAVDCDAVVYLSNFDNYPSSVATLARGRELWGNPPEVLRRVRDPRRVTAALRERGFAAPDVYLQDRPPKAYVNAGPPEGGHSGLKDGPPEGGHYVLKPRASGGGVGIRAWDGGRVRRGCYLQARVDGVPGSIVFAAAGGRAVPLGLSRQLIGEPAFGAAGFRYCGNIMSSAGDPQFARDEALAEAASGLARAIAGAFDLVGVNGIDFVARDGVPHAVEVNPRWSASMELAERAWGVPVFAAHAAACGSGSLPGFDLARARRAGGAVGKAIVFARRDVIAGDTGLWLADPTVRDVPHPGERIQAGSPVCTVFAAARDGGACHAALVRRAARVYADLDAWQRDVA